MVKNSDLFKKVMMFSRELRMAAMFNGGPGKGDFPPHGFGPGKFGGPPFPHPFGEEGKPPFPHPFGGDGKPPFPPHGCGKGPGGPMGRGMNRERMLVIISEHPEGIRQKELAEAAGINASSTSEVVSRLEDDGYLIRTIDENDKRATVLKLTEMGAVRAEEIRAEREEFLDDFFKKLSEEEKQQLSDILDKLIEK